MVVIPIGVDTHAATTRGARARASPATHTAIVDRGKRPAGARTARLARRTGRSRPASTYARFARLPLTTARRADRGHAHTADTRLIRGALPTAHPAVHSVGHHTDAALGAARGSSGARLPCPASASSIGACLAGPTRRRARARASATLAGLVSPALIVATTTMRGARLGIDARTITTDRPTRARHRARAAVAHARFGRPSLIRSSPCIVTDGAALSTSPKPKEEPWNEQESGARRKIAIRKREHKHLEFRAFATKRQTGA